MPITPATARKLSDDALRFAARDIADALAAADALGAGPRDEARITRYLDEQLAVAGERKRREEERARIAREYQERNPGTTDEQAAYIAACTTIR
jgi:hypothetical protein